MKYPINYEAVIKIYQSCRKNQMLFLCCMLFAVGGVYLITDEGESCRFVIEFIVCWLSVIFLGGGGSFLGVTTLYNAINRIPYLIIYDDRVGAIRAIYGSIKYNISCRYKEFQTN